MKNQHKKKRNLFTALRGMRHWAEVFILRRTFSSFYIPKLNLSFKVPSNTIFSWHLSKYRVYEPDSLDFLLKRFKLDQGGLFIDVGANFGWYSLIFSKFAGATGQIISFEPDQKNFELLSHNKNLNAAANIEAIQIAVGESHGEVLLGHAPDTNPGMHSLVDLPHINKDNAQTVQIRRLDDVLKDHAGLIDLLKIDIEGFEVAAFLGGRETLRRCKLILAEYSPAFIEASGYKKTQFFELLQEAGFDIYEIEEDKLKILTPADLHALSSRATDPLYWQQDFFCINSQPASAA